ncbi:hypothetical protein HMPREF9104_01208 [Lentilactobacillus kisonensis F0435]|uniref:Uncharacterized protein n=1 Tax=Lentilactobacillus kisonensis F0435 TaxID=797516 RepID=H1LF32_9LACO|nr:hypothetical protein HMPREF9104_01208 [Lentilactobacillus kisonensis F0435]
MMFNRYFYKRFKFWVGVIIAYLNRTIFIHVSPLNIFWIIDVAIFIMAIYLIISNLVTTRKNVKDVSE